MRGQPLFTGDAPVGAVILAVETQVDLDHAHHQRGPVFDHTDGIAEFDSRFFGGRSGTG